MEAEYIGKDGYGREMRLYHSCNTVFRDHIKNGRVVRTGQQMVDNRIIMMFGARHISGAYIYDEVKRIYGKSL
jgi:hypothetical protein